MDAIQNINGLNTCSPSTRRISFLMLIGHKRTSVDDASPLYVICSIRYRAVEYQMNLKANRHKNSPMNMPTALKENQLIDMNTATTIYLKKWMLKCNILSRSIAKLRCLSRKNSDQCSVWEQSQLVQLPISPFR